MVHLIRNSIKYVTWKDRRAVVAALKPIYAAPTLAGAADALDTFEIEWGERYPAIVNLWRRDWERFTPFLGFDPAIRRIIYTTNTIESLNYRLRKVTKTKGHFPNDAAAVKLLWLAICNIEDKRARDRERERGLGRGAKRKAEPRLVEGAVTTNWKRALEQLALAYPDRLNPYL